MIAVHAETVNWRGQALVDLRALGASRASRARGPSARSLGSPRPSWRFLDGNRWRRLNRGQPLHEPTLSARCLVLVDHALDRRLVQLTRRFDNRARSLFDGAASETYARLLDVRTNL